MVNKPGLSRSTIVLRQIILVPVPYHASGIEALHKLVIYTRPNYVVAPTEVAWRTQQERRPLAQRLREDQAHGLLHAMQSIFNLWNLHGHAVAMQFVLAELALGASPWTLLIRTADAVDESNAQLVPVPVHEVAFVLQAYAAVEAWVDNLQFSRDMGRSVQKDDVDDDAWGSVVKPAAPVKFSPRALLTKSFYTTFMQRIFVEELLKQEYSPASMARPAVEACMRVATGAEDLN